MNVLEKLGLGESPVLLAPLAGVSDHPFRRICSQHGADLTYVEMLSATALTYRSQKTFDMMERHSEEAKLGVQLTGKNPDEVAEAVAILDDYSFETIDINMGCPVRKVIKQGAGSAILQDPERIYETVRKAKAATNKILTCKIRLGFREKNMVEIAKACEEGGAEWITVHGRTREEDYSIPVDLNGISEVVDAVSVPVFGNGNIFSRTDAETMKEKTGVKGVMVSRAAMGDPWVFNMIKGEAAETSLEDWLSGLRWHTEAQFSAYSQRPKGVICLRKHLIWYSKGWPGSKALREEVRSIESFDQARALIDRYETFLRQRGETTRKIDPSGDFSWEPKWDMDRKLDRGVGDDQMVPS